MIACEFDSDHGIAKNSGKDNNSAVITSDWVAVLMVVGKEWAGLKEYLRSVMNGVVRSLH